MSRSILPLDNIHPSIHAKLGGGHDKIISEVKQAIESHAVVVVGMKVNPFVKKARNLLAQLGIEFTYLEYGSYVSQWHPRLAIKMWTGYKTFPQIFIKGTLIGGFSELNSLVKANQVNALLKSDDS